MQIDMAAASPSTAYYVMTQTIVPRPVAWVLTDNGNGSYNLAPFSYFTAVCGDPAILVFSVGYKSDGSPKDTRVNIQARAHFVVHIATTALAPAVTSTARSLPFGESELDHIEHELAVFEPIDGRQIALPRLAACPIAMACTLECVHEVGNIKQAMIYGRIECVYISDTVAKRDEHGRLHVDIAALNPLARLGGNHYAGLTRPFAIRRPD